MRVHLIALSAAITLGAAIPAIALAQTPAQTAAQQAAQQAAAQQATQRAIAADRARLDVQLRAAQAQDNLRQFDANQKADQVDRSITDLDLKLRTQQNLNSGPTLPVYYPTDPVPGAALPSGIDTKAQTAMQNQELQGENDRLRALDAAGK